MIPVTKPFLPPKASYDRVLETTWGNNWLTNNGPLLRELEEKVMNFLGTKNMVFVTNGTVAIQIALKALDVTKEVITTPFSYVATTSAPAWENCELVFADIDPNSLNISPSSIESMITPDTQAILATHVFGNPVDIEAIEDIANKHNLKVIYDAAHCFGVEYNGKSIFEYGDISTLSTHATKIFHTVEGGFMSARNADTMRMINLMKNFGHDGVDKFSAIGINGKNSEFHAAMGLANLDHIQGILERRKSQYLIYKDRLSDHENIRLQTINANTKYNYSYFPIIMNDENILFAVRDALQENKIVPRRYFYPSLNTLDYVNYTPTPIAEKIARTILCLPLYHSLENDDIHRICDIITKTCLLYTSPSPRDQRGSRMPSSA